jgi:hypothetical protein
MNNAGWGTGVGWVTQHPTPVYSLISATSLAFAPAPCTGAEACPPSAPSQDRPASLQVES